MFAGGYIIEKKERLRSLHEDVVDAVVDEVAPYAVVAPCTLGHFELGADTVCTGDQDHTAATHPRGIEEPAEETDVPNHSGGKTRTYGTLGALEGFVFGVDVDASIFVG